MACASPSTRTSRSRPPGARSTPHPTAQVKHPVALDRQVPGRRRRRRRHWGAPELGLSL
ncbi:MAG: hypothetical protein AVDCRST_MAG54-4834 [uncultured Actinomycetospora sp.]|uniref:Uncharacterized protein n=1 Tax=uncultured Actinomycetospora sp. TaxID=1135996 RepID=A0A6J4K609_9PSEU|nr:MAG: hypothetical protein AVDCRST_MAG54-4834 [uncultured Actinomycetospora sp.]